MIFALRNLKFFEYYYRTIHYDCTEMRHCGQLKVGTPHAIQQRIRCILIHESLLANSFVHSLDENS